MSNSWNNKLKNTSPGFVYFKTSKSFQSDSSSDTTDFLSFSANSCASPPLKRFSPSIYSSPKGNNFHYQSLRNRNYQNNSYYQNNSIYDSNSHSRHNYGYHRNKSWKKNNSFGFQSHKNSFNEFGDNQKQNTSTYYDPSCVIDPWVELEEKLKSEENTSSSQIANPDSEDSSSEESSEEESSPSISSEDKDPES